MTQNTRIAKGFGMISRDVIRDPEISLREKAIYAYLSSYADQDNELHVSLNRIAAECNVDKSTVKRIFNILKEKGIIVRERRGVGQSYRTILIK